MKAQEVRLLCRCPVCGKLGDEHAMIKYPILLLSPSTKPSENIPKTGSSTAMPHDWGDILLYDAVARFGALCPIGSLTRRPPPVLIDQHFTTRQMNSQLHLIPPFRHGSANSQWFCLTHEPDKGAVFESSTS